MKELATRWSLHRTTVAAQCVRLASGSADRASLLTTWTRPRGSTAMAGHYSG
jgi:hypothetical protein